MTDHPAPSALFGTEVAEKSPKRIADEMQHTYEQYGIEFQWLTDDNFGLGAHTRELCWELIDRGLSQDIMWFMQARCDDVGRHESLIPTLSKAGLRWILTGVESSSESTLEAFNKKFGLKTLRTRYRS